MCDRSATQLFERIFEGSDADVARLVTIGSIEYRGGYLPLSFKVERVVATLAEYDLGVAGYLAPPVKNIFVRPVNSVQVEIASFLQLLCGKGLDELKNSLSSSPKKDEALLYLGRYGTKYTIQMNELMTLSNGQTVKYDGNDFTCTYRPGGRK